ncbi:hypothetical protein ACHAXH_004671 [Discostella pseudostelligera]
MCVTNSARRRSSVLQVFPCHLVKASPTAVTVDTTASDQAVRASTKTSSHPAKAKGKKSKVARHDDAQVHQYHDHATDMVVDPTSIKHKAKGGVTTPFPVKLHNMLDQIEADGLAHVVSWQPHGRCFVVHEPKEFVRHVMPHYFKQTKIASFQRQLNLYGFSRLTGGLDKGGYYHELFLRSNRSLAYDIHRIRIKGTGVRLPTDPDNEPNFYALPPAVTAAAMPGKANMNSSTLPNILPTDTTSSAFVDINCRDNDWSTNGFSRVIAQAKYQQEQGQVESDVAFFEGLPFHYLDLNAFIVPGANQSQVVPSSQLLAESTQSKFADSDSTVTSESSSNVSEAYNMDWNAPLSFPTLQEHMRRSSLQYFGKDCAFADSQQLEDDIDTFFKSFSMPVEMYHEKIEQMSDDDDATFGYLIEQAISQ